MLDPERKLLGCLVEKSGSSSWHKVFWELREPSNAFVPSEAYAKNFKFAGTIGDNVWSEAMNDPTWIRFVTVRHPLARLYSGWNRFLFLARVTSFKPASVNLLLNSEICAKAGRWRRRSSPR
jgi:hypothetical protein